MLLGVPDAMMTHTVGERRKELWFLRTRTISFHKPFRYYYIYRNSVLLYKRGYMQLDWKLADLARCLKMLLVFALMHDQRLTCMKMIALGVFDGLRGKSGQMGGLAPDMRKAHRHSTLKLYGFIGTIRLARDVIFSRLFFRNIRLIRYPWYVRGAFAITFGRGFTSGVGLRVDAFGPDKNQLVFGKNVQVGDYVHIAAMKSVSIGDHVLMGSKVFISDHDHGTYRDYGDGVSKPDDIQAERLLQVVPVKIGRNVWIGENVCILKGVEIGENTIVAASAVVTRSVPADSIVAGNPARVIRRYDHALASWEKCGV